MHPYHSTMHPRKWLKSPLNRFEAWFLILSDKQAPQKAKRNRRTLPHACTQQATSKATPALRQAIQKQWAKLRPGVRHQKAKKKPSTRPGQFLRFCLISSVIRIRRARAIRAKSLFIVHPINWIEGLIEEITLGLKPVPSIKLHEMFNPG